MEQTCTYKDLLLRKLSYAVTSSVFSQLFILLFYVFLFNTNVFYPLEWIQRTFRTMTSISTWIFMVPFLAIIFAQCVICAKDYVVKSSFCSTRFQKFLRAFSLHNIILLVLHIIVGATSTWLFLSISDGQYSNLTEVCKGGAYCLNDGSFFLILSGLWTGFYFFLKVYVAEKNLAFPVIHQRKFLQLKSQLSPIIRESVHLSFWPSFYFGLIYSIVGELVANSFKGFLGLLDREEKPTALIYSHLWFFSALYYFNMNLMRFYFNLFLTEPVHFPVVKDQLGTNLTLQDSITNYDWPIVQNLACLDLHLLSRWSPLRRQAFFALSNPGGHPHNWNSLVESVLKLVTEYTQLLNKTIDLPEAKVMPSIIQAPIIQGPDKFRNLRNMALIDEDCYSYIDVSKGSAPVPFSFKPNILDGISAKLKSTWNFLKLISGVNFLFDELPQANVRKCLANGNLIIWSSQGISDIIAASLDEDKFGIVQKDLPVIISSLVQLKQSLDKLNKVPALTRKMVGYDDFNYKMKGAVTAAVKRSLFNICSSFNDYLRDIPLSKDIFHYLQVQIICKN